MKFKIPFFKKKEDDIDEVGPDNGLSDELDYLGPSALQKRLPWIAVVGAYVLTFVGIASVISYLVLNADHIEEEMRADRPQLNIDRLKVEIIETAAEAGDHEETVSADQAEVDEATQVAESHEDPSDTETVGEETVSQEATLAETDIDGPIVPDTYGSMLQDHPDPALVEESPVGLLPKIGEDGRKPWQVYSRPVNSLERRPKVAVVVTSLGISEKQTKAALSLPGSMTLAFAPYSSKLENWISESRSAGHEVLITLPMEPVDFPKSDPGPFALLSTLDANQNLRRLEWIMSRGTGYVGLVNFMGSRFSSNEKIMKPIFTVMKDRGLAYLDTKETTVDTASKIATKIGVPNISADLLIDDNLSRASIVASLARIENLAKTNGSAIAIARPYPVTIERLKAWSRDLQAKGIVLVPISSLIASKANAS